MHKGLDQMPNHPTRKLVVVLAGIVLTGLLETPAQATSVVKSRSNTFLPVKRDRSQTRLVCPTELPSLMDVMLRDLPGYINRTYYRTVGRQAGRASYAIAASQPEFVPLPLNSSEYDNPKDDTLHQVFFTVLERQYVGRQVTQLQNYYWMFLTQTREGWQLAFMFSRIGPYPASNLQPPTPSRESSQGIAAQAVRTWLRDCRAGSIKL